VAAVNFHEYSLSNLAKFLRNLASIKFHVSYALHVQKLETNYDHASLHLGYGASKLHHRVPSLRICNHGANHRDRYDELIANSQIRPLLDVEQR
jgi:hypothetical protein